MAYINKNDFTIVSFVDVLFEDQYFECDDLIAPAISLLNKKGYKTLFCCSGHPYGSIDTDICEEDDTEIDESFVLRRGKSIDIKYECNLDDKEIEEYPYYISYKNNALDSAFYIAFKERYQFSYLPSDFYTDETLLIDDNNNNLIVTAIRCNLDLYTSDNDGFKYITEIFELNKRFYEWVEKLPNLKE